MTNAKVNFFGSITNTATHPGAFVAWPNGALQDVFYTTASSLQDIDTINVKKSVIEGTFTGNGEFRITPVLVLVQTGYTHTTPTRIGDNATYSIQSLLDSAFDKPLDYKIYPSKWSQRPSTESAHQSRVHIKVNISKQMKRWIKNYFHDPNWILGVSTSTMILCALIEVPTEEALVIYWRGIHEVEFEEVAKTGLGI